MEENIIADTLYVSFVPGAVLCALHVSTHLIHKQCYEIGY